jgi:hypothetical protein
MAVAGAPALNDDARMIVTACLVALGVDEHNAALAESIRKAAARRSTACRSTC